MSFTIRKGEAEVDQDMSENQEPKVKKKLIVCDTRKCTGCQVCEYVCSVVKEGTINWKKSRIRTIRIEPFFNTILACQKCKDAKCVDACPTDAICIDEKTKQVLIDNDKCDACGWCIEACEFGALRLHLNDKIVFTCDFCKELDEPACITYCPKKALKLVEIEERPDENDKQAFTRLIKEARAQTTDKTT